MAFINRSDYKSVIDEHILSEVLRFDESYLATAEKRAISYATGYLNARFDTETLFEQEDDDRHPLVLLHVLNITLYYLHQKVAADQVPQNILDNYVEATDWFKAVNKGEVAPPDLPMFEDGERDHVLYGGNEARNHHI